MKKLLLVTGFFLMVSITFCQVDSTKTRLIILADMGNEPDEEQQMMHMLMCSNEFDLEGLISSSIDIPGDAGGSEIHIILEVKDLNEIGSLWDYRRLVLNVNPL